MNKFVEILLGLVLLLVPIYAWIVDFAGFGTAAMIVFKGAIVWMVLLAGLVLLLVGLSSLKD
ncbi:MAG: hypothetical protein OEL87_01450 [Nanoarchaeota archaeon]|nr:hypothetical protein [Nanoarchaeota archaeon]